MSICFLFIISTFHLSFTILSFIASTFSFVILITLHLHSFVIIPPSGISQLIFFSFDSNTIFLVPLMLSTLGVYPGQWENCMVENLDSVIFFWKAFTYCLANNYMIRLHLQSVSFEISTNSILSTIFFSFYLLGRMPACTIYRPGRALVIIHRIQFSSVQFSCSVVSDSLQPQESQHTRPPYLSPTPEAHSNSCPSSQWCHPVISSSVVPFSSCLQYLPASVFSSESTLRMRCPKYWSFSFSISPSNEHPGLISFRMDWLDLLAVQGTLKSLLQHYSSPKYSILSRTLGHSYSPAQVMDFLFKFSCLSLCC